ncbi:helix-turn-helix domain-containing protein [Portibacter marinus]|uniref:helix-turn-helix domain-containing protein n=1 Tax=Portibacter marinus TaxID=2898660 RepID=UPI001F3BCBB0|nr:AraC family transcriptional regulator [Portibacter marinus]
MISSFNIVPTLSHLFESFNSIVIQQQGKLHLTISCENIIVNTDPYQLIRETTLLLSFIRSMPAQPEEMLCILEPKDSNRHQFSLMFKEFTANFTQVKRFNAQLESYDISCIDDNLVALYFKKDALVKKVNETIHKNYDIPPYYAEIKQKLQAHFSSVDSLEKMANRKSLAHGLFLKKVNQALENNLESENFKIDDLCKYLAISRSQLYRRISPVLKMSPAKYLIYFKLQKARSLLQQTTYSIGEVISMVGFSSQSHFSRAFKDQFGMNPSHFKKKK